MFLNFKGIDWISHPLDLVPCVVHDGHVHIESNDIIQHLERYPTLPGAPDVFRCCPRPLTFVAMTYQWIATRGGTRLDDLSRYVVTHERWQICCDRE